MCFPICVFISVFIIWYRFALCGKSICRFGQLHLPYRATRIFHKGKSFFRERIPCCAVIFGLVIVACFDESFIDEALEENMEEVVDVVVLGRACRNAANIKNRQPLSDMYVKCEREISDYYREIVEEELNIKHVEFVADVSPFSSYSFKPQLKTVGPKYGKLLNGIREHLSSLDGTAAKAELDANGALKFEVNGESVELTVDDLLISTVQKEGLFSVSDNGISVILDTNLTPELINEGLVREIISKIQTMRKEAGFEVVDHINVYYTEADGTAVSDAITANAEEIRSNVLAQSIKNAQGNGYTKEWDINGKSVTLTVEKI